MSSSTTLGRSRSLRKPAPPIGGADAATRTHNDKDAAASGLRNASPSRLPVKPSTTAGNARPPASTGAAPGTKPRPISGILGRAASVRQTKPAVQEQTETATKNSFTARPTRSATVTASSARAPASRPTTSGGSAAASTAKPRAIGHSRAKSSATALTSSTVLRPPSAASSGTSSSTASRPPVTRANPPITSTHRRQLSQPAVSGSSTSTTSGATTQSRLKTTTSATDDAPRLRPAFSTLQQHYSPARNLAPKPLTATFLAPPSPSKLPTNVAISAETARLQTELLQLHLLHRDSAVVDQEWRASARQKLGERFASLVKENKDLSQEEASVIEKRNIAVLRSWGATHAAGRGIGSTALEEKIQVLDIVLSGLWSLGEPGGKYARVVRRFERWVERTVEVAEARRRGGGLGVLDGEEVIFIGELDSVWRDECAGLVRKLDGWRKQLKELGEAPGEAEEVTPGGEQSSLAQILDGCRNLVHDMLAELNIMEHIEKDALKQETDWIQKMNRDEMDDDMPKAGAIWRAF